MNDRLSDQDTLDLARVRGVRGHYDHTSQIPTLIFREHRRISVILNPFPGVLRLTVSGEHRSLIPGKNTLNPPLELQTGDSLGFAPLMSACESPAATVQVPVEAVDDIGELELPDELDDQATASGSIEPDTGETEEHQNGPNDEDVDLALALVMEPLDGQVAPLTDPPSSSRNDSSGVAFTFGQRSSRHGRFWIRFVSSTLAGGTR